MRVVYARATTSIGLPHGQRIVVGAGTHWPADDPVVRDHPELFSDDPRYGMVWTAKPAGWDDPPVEQATAAPGEKRATRRPHNGD